MGGPGSSRRFNGVVTRTQPRAVTILTPISIALSLPPCLCARCVMRDVLNRWRRALVVGVCVLCATGSVRLHAQSEAGTATLAGTVLDPDGKVVVDAALLIRNEMSGDVRTATTDGSGRFSIPGLPTGLYTIEVGVPGFDVVRRGGVQLTTGKPEDLSIRLSLANISETVTVSTALPAAAVA